MGVQGKGQSGLIPEVQGAGVDGYKVGKMTGLYGEAMGIMGVARLIIGVPGINGKSTELIGT